MEALTSTLQWILLIPAIGGMVYSILCLLAVSAFLRAPSSAKAPLPSLLPPVTVLKPVHGLEKNLENNLRSILLQDYPEYQVVYSVQSEEDQALPLLKGLQREFGTHRVSVAMMNIQAGQNGKVNNLLGAMTHARYETLVICDSDVIVRPDYLRTLVAPLADPAVGAACTLFKATQARRWFEKIELLSINADFMPSVVFAYKTGASDLCLGPSIAFRRSTLKEIGGLESLAEYLVEDYEIGRRIGESGKKVVLVPYLIDVVVDLETVDQWWKHQLYWDQNTRFARPLGFFATVLIRSVPFALLFALARAADPLGLGVLLAATAVRLATAAGVLRRFQDREGLRSLAHLPLRDILGLAFWALAFTKRTVVWRGKEFNLTHDGRLVPREAGR